MTEIKGYKDYTIDREGKVWSKYNDRFLNPSLTKKGYLNITLYKNGKSKTHYIHGLLALTYIPNPENKPTVDHIDINPSNNSLSNLRWATEAEQNENRGAYGEIKHKLICYEYKKNGKYKYYHIQKEGYFKKLLNVNKYTLKDAVDLRRSFLMYYKLEAIPQDE
mgnify:CR=1 FL=1|tara:strand:- start:390 stop:881 length:492 start_codon:yes stop_codon:yes gene_type:complete